MTAAAAGEGGLGTTPSSSPGLSTRESGDAADRSAPSGTELKIRADGLRKVFSSDGEDVVAIEELSAEIGDGQFVSVVGPSGCGKTTFLRILAGLDDPTSGRLQLMPEDSGRPFNAVVFQEYGLFPWKTVAENIAFGLTMRRRPRDEREATTREWLERVGLTSFREAYPHELSGGMKQRVSIARALANDPEVLLMDEPLGALDAQTRTVMQQELLDLWRTERKTVVYITHSLDEAVFLSDRVLVMTAHPGRKKSEYEVPLARPRTKEMESSADFKQLSLEIWNDLEVEVRQTIGEHGL